MFKIEDGREHFYQWDLDRRLIIEDPEVKQVHFTNRATNDAYVCETYVEDGKTLVNVPNILLQANWRIQAYAYDGKHTKHDKCYEVKSRSKPNDYAYTETEILNWEKIDEKVNEAIMDAEVATDAAWEMIDEGQFVIDEGYMMINEVNTAVMDASIALNEFNEEANRAKQIADDAQAATDNAVNLATGVAEAIEKAEMAAAFAETEAEGASDAAEYAEGAGTSANTAAGEAYEAIEAINKTTQDIIAATNEAIDAATHATSQALDATGYANEATHYANEATDAANEAADNANAAASGINDKFANALKGNVRDEAVVMTDTSPIEHTMKVKASSKNLVDMAIFDKYVYSNGSANTYDATAHTITMDVDAANNSSGRYKRLITNDTTGKQYTLSFEVRGTEGRRVVIGAEHAPTKIILTNEYVRYSQVVKAKSATKNLDIVFFSSKASDGGLLAGEYMQFANVQLEEGITLTDYTPYVDVSSVNVNKYGKNLFDGIFELGIWSGTNGVAYDNDTRIRGKNFIEVKDDTTYSFVFEGYNPAILIYEYDKDYNYIPTNGSNLVIHYGTPYTPTKGAKYIHFSPNATVPVEVIDVVKCQMEVGEKQTTIENYVEPETYTVSADGTVEGITALYPSTTLFSDASGVVVDCEYNKDLNKAFAELQQAIISLGGNV